MMPRTPASEPVRRAIPLITRPMSARPMSARPVSARPMSARPMSGTPARPSSHRPSSTEFVGVNTPSNHLRCAMGASPVTARSIGGRQAPARAWAAREARSHGSARDAQSYVLCKAAPFEPAGDCAPPLAAGAVGATTGHDRLRWRLAGDSPKTPTKKQSSRDVPGGRLLDALSELQNKPHALHERRTSTGEALTDGGVSISQMQAALAVESRLRAPTTTSVAAEMEHAIARASEKPPPRPRLPVSARLEKLEQGLQRDLVVTSATERITHLLQRHRKALQSKFAEWDLDGNGQISRAELQHVLEQCGIHMRSSELDEFFVEFDPDRSGSLNIREFYGIAYSGGPRYAR